MSDIDVSVYMPTYFHEKYVAAAIESVLKQKTHYKYEIVISDDCSEDNTVKIVKEYQEKYPDIIKLYVNQENIGIPQNMFKGRCLCSGRYIADISGDDYWIDEDKLERQTKFMDDHPEYVISFNKVELRMDESLIAYDSVPRSNKQLNKEYTLHDYECCIPIGSHGSFMRNYWSTEEGKTYFAQALTISDFVDDAADEVLLLKKGKAYVVDFGATAHRVFSKKEHNYNSRYGKLDRFDHHIELLNAMHDMWGAEIDFSNWYANYNALGVLAMIYERQLTKYLNILKKVPSKYKRGIINNINIKTIRFIVRMVLGRLRRRIVIHF